MKMTQIAVAPVRSVVDLSAHGLHANSTRRILVTTPTMKASLKLNRGRKHMNLANLRTMGTSQPGGFTNIVVRWDKHHSREIRNDEFSESLNAVNVDAGGCLETHGGTWASSAPHARCDRDVVWLKQNAWPKPFAINFSSPEGVVGC
jgi:hypothetical protein